MVWRCTQWSWTLKDINATHCWRDETDVKPVKKHQRVIISRPPHPAGWSRKLSWPLHLCHTKPGRCTSPLHPSEAPLWLKQRCWWAPAYGPGCWIETGASSPVRSCKPRLHYYQFLTWWSPRWRWWAWWNHSPRWLSLPLLLLHGSECIPPPRGQVSPDL